MAWFYLLIAGVLEIGWPYGLKRAMEGDLVRPWWMVFATAAMLASGFFLMLAQRTLPIGTAYAIWTGIGAVGTFLLGVFLLGESREAARFLCVGLIAAGIIGLKLVSDH
jgi:quaternary ammonium compound-resistance protein SugE